ncbi:unnamed protein product [Clonostachys rosea]|uniref:Uncharacterized protein n=1 Tax=Bionectria ochroleuca TaxID=29856 RepID=A0ABY6UD74_BIOOC|nr:unnamed protein product [Clonostachys rosea]
MKKSTEYLDIFAVRNPSFKETAFDDERRHVLFREEIIDLLRQIYPSLPWELGAQITKYCIHEYAVAHILSRLGKDASRTFNPQNNVWAKYVNFEGVRYIHSLFNEDDEEFDKTGKKELVFDAGRGQLVDAIFINRTSLGIQDIIFGNSSERPLVSQQPGVWWKIMHFQHGATLRTDMDGIKLREIMSDSDERPYGHRVIKEVLWPTPTHYLRHILVPEQIFYARSFMDRDSRYMSRRMASVDLEVSGAFGLSFALCGLNPQHPIFTIHSHLAGEKTLFYREMDRKLEKHVIWQYVPLQPTESIIEIWAKKTEREWDEHSGTLVTDSQPLADYWLLVATNKGRAHRIGTANDDPTQQWNLLYASASGIKRIFFDHPDDSLYGTWSLGFDSQDPASELLPLTEPTAISPCLSRESGLIAHDCRTLCSSVMLNNVVEVTACLRKPEAWSTDRRKIVSGLLLYFADGHTERLGEARIEYLRRPIKVLDPSHVLCLGLGMDLVRSCTIRPAHELSQEDVIEIPLQGMLEWCFSREKIWIWYNGSLVLPVIHDEV